MSTQAPARAAVARLAQQRALTLRTQQAADRLWATVRPGRITPTYQLVAAQMVALLVAAQQQAASGAQDYVDQTVTELGGRPNNTAGALNASAFAGWAADGRSLVSLLDQPRITALTGIAAGLNETGAMQAGRYQLMRIMASETADAGRSASGVSMVGNRTVTGYVRVISPGACSRCVILAGTVWHTTKPFLRHPHCQCTNQPAILGDHSLPTVDPDAYFHSLTRAEQNLTFGEAGAQAIRDGADITSIVNIRRKGAVYTADAYGRRVLATREGTTARGAFFRAERRRAIERGHVPASGKGFQLRSPRLMPEEIYRLAESREEAIALLRRFGYFR